MSVNTKMTAIADAIRAKTGGTAALSLDAMAEAIAGLEIGSGISDHELFSGSFTPASNITTSYTIDTGIAHPAYGEDGYNAKDDSIYLVFHDSPELTMVSYSYEMLFAYKFGNITSGKYSNQQVTPYVIGISDSSYDKGYYSYATTSDHFSVTTSNGNIALWFAGDNDAKFKAGRRYTWVVIRRVLR